MLAAAGLRASPRTTFEKRHDMDDWLSATSCAGRRKEPRESGSLLAHVSEPDGAAWRDVKLVVRGSQVRTERPARADEQLTAQADRRALSQEVQASQRQPQTELCLLVVEVGLQDLGDPLRRW